MNPRSTKEILAEMRRAAEQYPNDEIYKAPDNGDYDHRLVREGLVSAIVCTRKTAEEAAAWLTKVRPPGTMANEWVPSTDHLFGPEPETPCGDWPETHRHVAVNC